jgi:hypothetical protein
MKIRTNKPAGAVGRRKFLTLIAIPFECFTVHDNSLN